MKNALYSYFIQQVSTALDFIFFRSLFVAVT